jgi:hypothetical protein
MPKILKAGTFGMYDVFTGNGWKNHTRVRWNNKVGHLQFVNGKHLTKNVVKEVLEHITKSLPPLVAVAPVEQKEVPAKPALYLVK